VRHGGKLAILAMFALGILAAVLSLLYLRQLGQRAQQFWGTPAARRILHAPRVEALLLEPTQGQATPPRLQFDGRSYHVLARADASQARGLLNIRRGLLTDASYQWEEPIRRQEVTWQYALVFQQEGSTATLLFSFDPPRAGLAGSQEQVSIAPVAPGLKRFFEDQFSSDPIPSRGAGAIR
jgi:hypothetical protein